VPENRSVVSLQRAGGGWWRIVEKIEPNDLRKLLVDVAGNHPAPGWPTDWDSIAGGGLQEIGRPAAKGERPL